MWKPLREQESNAGQIRKELQERLPGYMTPSQVVLLENLPRTPNGKVDRKALPEPESENITSSSRAPANEVEELLAGIWADVLKREHVGVEDNFFELGGHSLLATSIVARVEERFHVQLPLRTVFESPTVAGMARCSGAGRQRKPERASCAGDC